MSNALAVAQVTRALQNLLEEALAAAVPGNVAGAHAEIRRPDDTAIEPPKVTIFLYEMVPNAALRNADLATRDGGGRSLRRSQAAFDLRYLLTFFGTESTLEPHRMLATVARVLHDRPLLSPALLQAAATGPFAAADTARQGEAIRLTPIALGLEELSKLWSSFKEAPYRLSLAVQAGAILLEPDDAVATSLPVDSVGIGVAAARPPFIQTVRAAEGTGRPVVHGGGLVLEGLGLVAPVLQVRVGDATYGTATATDGALRVTLLGDALRAGVLPAQVVHLPPAPARAVPSNLGAFVLHPRLSDPVAETGAGPAKRLRATVAPPVGASQRAALLLDELAPPGPPNPAWQPRRHRLESWEFAPGTPGAPPPFGTLLDFVPTGVAAGSYLARIEVDGAQSVVRYPGPGGPAAPQAVVT